MISAVKNRKLKVLISFFNFLLFLAAGVDVGLGQQPQWKKEWKRTIAAAKKEGKLVYHAGSASAPYFREFHKRRTDAYTRRQRSGPTLNGRASSGSLCL